MIVYNNEHLESHQTILSKGSNSVTHEFVSG